MKASYGWLCELLPGLNLSPEEVAWHLTSVGLEVEGQHVFGAGTESCVVARVVSAKPHPKRDTLRLVTIDAGTTHGTFELVCGAPNVPVPTGGQPGGLVVLAPTGTFLPAKNMRIEPKDIAGVQSAGMLCSEAELGIGEGAGGIWLLDAVAPNAKPGQRLTDVIPYVNDTIFEIGLTPNRPDGLGHVGLARELAAFLERPFSSLGHRNGSPATRIAGKEARVGEVRIVIEDGTRTPHYGAALLDKVSIGPSPLSIALRLTALGIRPISNIVDITNYLMMKYGHPMHAFDRASIRGNTIVCRQAREGESLTTIDHVSRKLTTDDLVIADAEGPTALAGVMGGESSEIKAATNSVFFEVAYFEPRSVRRAGRRHAIHTESSHRFERGVDFGDTALVLQEAIAMAKELAGANVVDGPTVLEAESLTTPTTGLRRSKLNELLGVVIPFGVAVEILQRLGLEVVDRTKEAIRAKMPTHRPDLAREEDLIEEVMRHYGLDKIPVELPTLRPFRQKPSREDEMRALRGAAVSLGLSEAITYGFTSEKALSYFECPPATVVLQNPLSVEHSVMRTSLLPSLLGAAGHARRHGEPNAQIFTMGSLFLAGTKGALPVEKLSFAAILSGECAQHLAKPRPLDVYDVTGIAEGIVQRIAHKRATLVRFDAPPKHLHPRGAARIEIDGVRVGQLGPLHPEVLEHFELTHAMVIEFDAEALFGCTSTTRHYQPIPKFPPSPRDLAVVVSDRLPAREVEALIRETAGPLAESVHVFDRFSGASIPKDHVSLAFHVIYRSADRTLKDEEVDKVHANVIAAVAQKFGAALR